MYIDLFIKNMDLKFEKNIKNNYNKIIISNFSFKLKAYLCI
jgi:hypothetical protein